MQRKSKIKQPMKDETQLVDGPGLLAALFPENSRPTLRWLRDRQKKREIPYLKIGHLVRFNIPRVREALEKRHTIGYRG